MSCDSVQRQPSVDWEADDLEQIPQEPHSAVCSGGRWSCKARVRTDANRAIKPFAAPSGLGPADLASAYKLTGTPPAGTTVAIVDAFAYPNAASDLATYRSQFGLPPCTVANGCLVLDNTQGAGTAPANDDWTVEAALDLDMVSAACPTCKIVLIEAKDDQGNGLFDGQNQAANHAGVVAISDSWGGPSDGSDISEDSQFFTHNAGIGTFIASGDDGNTGSTPDYPSTSVKVTAVGGTSLVKSTTATRGWTEGCWSGAGSSCSTLEPKPSFQCVVSACAKRAASDVAAVADPNTGLATFNSAAGGWIVVGGTSAAAPFVAGMLARYRLAGQMPDYAYSHSLQFFDVKTGKNGICSGAMCQSRAGWDGCTGVGSPNGAVLGSDGSCAHPICSTGVNLIATCDPCAQQICAVDVFCCNNAWDPICVGEVSSVCQQTCEAVCCPSCVGKVCGPDGCGGSCGTPNCAGKICGNDGCGGSCGMCGAGQICSSGGACVCAPNTCGASCSICPSNTHCDATGACACNNCGTGGCCGPGQTCVGGTCQ